MFAVQRAEALDGLGRTSDAADVLLEVLVDEGVIDVHLGILVESLRRAGRPLDELAAAIPAARAPNFLAQVLQLSPETADAVLEACMAQMDDRRVVLATAASLARVPACRPCPDLVGPDARGRVHDQLPAGGHRHRPSLATDPGPGGGHRGRRLRRPPRARRLHGGVRRRVTSGTRDDPYRSAGACVRTSSPTPRRRPGRRRSLHGERAGRRPG